jgi:predicted DsbA family dithiol-disulfide isomerase/uncharacterized membrane protein
VAGLALSFLPVVGGLMASAALLVDQLRARPVFCPVGGGCDALKHTAFAAPLHVPLPVIGLVGFLAIGVFALRPGWPARRAELILAAIAGLVGLFLFAVQLSIGELCPYCCVADASGIAAALAAAVRAAFVRDLTPSRWMSHVAVGSFVLAIGIPLAAGFHKSAVPRAIREEMARTSRGDVTVVDFVDFECPYCRMTHAELTPVLEAHKQHVRLVRLQVPLRSHPHALDAARAACCAERLGQGDAMAAALFSAPVEELTRDGCEAMAVRVGLALTDYRSCVDDPTTQAHIDRDRAEFKAADGHALPTIWIGEQELVGAQSSETLARVLEGAIARTGS